MFRLIRRWFTPSYTNLVKFEYSPKGFQKAKRWAKVRPHPFLINLNLWDYVNSEFIDSEHKLAEINKRKENYENKK